MQTNGNKFTFEHRRIQDFNSKYKYAKIKVIIYLDYLLLEFDYPHLQI